MILDPLEEIQAEGDRFRSTGTSPFLALRCNGGEMPCGWVEVRYRAKAGNQAVSPILHVDSGRGFSVTGGIRLQANGTGLCRQIVRLPDRVAGLRLQPMAGPGVVAIDEFEVRKVRRPELFLRACTTWISAAAARPRQAAGLFRSALGVARRDGLRSLAGRLALGEVPTSSEDEYQLWIERYDRLTAADRTAIRTRIDSLPYRPRISVVMPVYDPPEKFLRLAVDSVLRQLYPDWELCIADDASTNSAIGAILRNYERRDDRIRVAFRGANGGISAASNSALALASGDFIAFLDHDDELSEHALYLVAEQLNACPEADVVYSDHDKIDARGRRFAPYFKPDWSPDLFYAQNYVAHFLVCRASSVRAVGGLRPEFDGSQDYDLALRLQEQTTPERVRHVPFVLYHWRTHPSSTAAGMEAKPFAIAAARAALRSHFDRRGLPVEVTGAPVPGFHRVVYPLSDPPPLVSVIVPTRDRPDVLRLCVDGVLERTDYPSIELLVVANQSEQPETVRYLESLQAEARVEVIRYDRPFNYAAINNFAVARSRGDVLAFLNDDTEVISESWLSEMVAESLRPEIGSVGAKLYYPDGSVQHAGILLGRDGVPANALRGHPGNSPGHYRRGVLPANVSAVTGACLVMRREVFEKAGGFDEDNLPIAFNDVDLCLRIGALGLRVLWTPYAELYHHESLSLGRPGCPERQEQFRREVRYLRSRWGEILENDPYYNPNLSVDPDFQFRPAFSPRVARPWIAEHSAGVTAGARE